MKLKTGMSQAAFHAMKDDIMPQNIVTSKKWPKNMNLYLVSLSPTSAEVAASQPLPVHSCQGDCCCSPEKAELIGTLSFVQTGESAYAQILHPC